MAEEIIRPEYPLGKGNLLDVINTEYGDGVTGRFMHIRGDDLDREKIAISFMDQDPGQYWIRTNSTVEAGENAFAGLSGRSRLLKSSHFDDGQFDYISLPHDLATGNRGVIEARLKYFQDELAEYLKDESGEFHDILTNQKQVVDDFLTQGEYSTRELGNMSRCFQLKVGNVANLASSLYPAAVLKCYSEFRGVDMHDSRMDFIVHKHVPFRPMLVMEHPNLPGVYHVEWEDKDSEWGYGSFDTSIERLDNLREDTMPDTLRDTVRLCADATKLLDPEMTYVFEAGAEPTTIVQATPIVRKQERTGSRIMSTLAHRIIGNIPEEGIEFEYNSEERRYPGLRIVSNKEIKEELLPQDIETGDHLKLLIPLYMARHHYLEHNGINNLQGTEIFDNTSTAENFSTPLDLRKAFDRVDGSPKIRYFINKKGHTTFEKVA